MQPFYNNGDGYIGYHVGHVTLIAGSHLWHVYFLPRKFMEHNFNEDLLKNTVTIRYGPYEWTIKIIKLWNIHYYILDFSQI
ncbi:hypothetical protein Hanom_Chr08g00725981 [Helianthus anomalus]